MAIIIPNLAAAKANAITVCGISSLQNEKVKELVTKYKKRWTYYDQDTPTGPVHIRLGIDASDKGYHLHVDLGTRNHFDDDEPPTPSSNVPGFDDMLSAFMGEKLEAVINGYFSCAISDVPEVIKITQKITASSGGVTLKMTSGSFSVKGSPIKRISWQTKAEKVLITLGSLEVLKVSEKYLQEALDSVSAYYSAFMRKGVPDGNR
jgi:hypothetical protein